MNDPRQPSKRFLAEKPASDSMSDDMPPREPQLNQERFHTILENTREYAVYMLDPEGCITHWNRGAERITGYKSDEIIGTGFARFFSPEHADRGLPQRHLKLARSQGRYECEGWRLRKNGSRFWARTILIPFTDELGHLKGFTKIMHDISERRRAKEDLRSYAERLRSTSRRLVEIQETERRTIARELHDRVGQNLTALGLHLKLIANELPEDCCNNARTRLDESTALLRRTVDAMRDVMAELRPQVLDDYGLLPTLRLAAAVFTQRTGIKAEVYGKDVPALPKEVGLAMFRICQEALNNVTKHAHAQQVNIRLGESAGTAQLEIHDDGIGFDATRITSSQPANRWGLQIMRERAEAVGASFSIMSGPAAGTRIIITYRI